MTFTVPVTIPTGNVTVSVVHEIPEDAWSTAIIAHGAGAGMDHPFLVGFAAGLRSQGIATARFNFPAMEAGKKLAGPASHALPTWRAVRDAVTTTGPVWLIGKSFGGRMASLAAADGMPGDALVYLGYPLHAPGRPEKPKREHLPSIEVPQLFVEGTKDPFVVPHEQLNDVVASCQDAHISWIEGGGHSFEVAGNKREADVIGADLAPIVAGFLRSLRVSR